MDYDFLPSKPEKPNTSTGTGGSFAVGKKIFIDKYLHHLDAHKVFSTPAIKSEFNIVANYNYAATHFFSERTLQEKSKQGFYGSDTDYKKLIEGYTEFQNPKLLHDVLNQLEEEIPSDLFSNIEKPKMKINDRFGMFSFDLASMAMTYVYEYFDKKGNKVDANFVEKKNTKFYFEGVEVDQKIKLRADGTPVVVSSVRNCLIDYDKKDKKERSVEIFVVNSISYKEKANNIIYNSMAAISVAKNLILKGFQVKLTALLSTVNGKSSTQYYHFVPVKRFNQPLDINAAAYVLGDPRFYRYQGFKLYLHGYDENQEISPDNLGTIITDKNIISKTIEAEYVPNSGLKQADTRLYFGNSRNLAEVKKEVTAALLILNERYGKDKN